MIRLLFILYFLSSPFAAAERSITVFVALCDNDTQAIAPVPNRIGDGNDPANNLYWGCSDGMKSYFKASRKWTLVATTVPEGAHILERCEFKHGATGTKLVAYAYRGRDMKRCLEDFFTAVRDAGSGQLVAFIGHNGLMDNDPAFPKPPPADDPASEAIVLGCLTDSYFSKRLETYHSRPLLLTSQLMYPGSFILHDCIEIWMKKGSRREHREAAAKAYARNQKISTKAARTVFAKLDG